MQKTTKLILLINSGIILILLLIGAWLWYAQSQLFVRAGLAKSEFPYKLYTTFELSGMYSQEPLENVTTTQTPEQTHALFIAALRKGDIDSAVECCVLKNSQEKMREKLNRIKDNNNFMLMVRDIENIEKEFLYEEGTASYIFQGNYKGEKVGGIMTFQKNLQGVWMIESF